MRANILVVEDSPDLCRLFEYILRAEQYRVEAVSSWQQAPDRMQTRTTDLLIFDWALDNTAGYQWVESLRATDEYAGLPILFVCGDMPTRALLAHLDGHDIAVIEKPFDVMGLRRRVGELLSMRERALGVG